jgi:hypothetical protein
MWQCLFHQVDAADDPGLGSQPQRPPTSGQGCHALSFPLFQLQINGEARLLTGVAGAPSSPFFLPTNKQTNGRHSQRPSRRIV